VYYAIGPRRGPGAYLRSRNWSPGWGGALRARGERQCRRSTEQGDELAPSHKLPSDAKIIILDIDQGLKGRLVGIVYCVEMGERPFRSADYATRSCLRAYEECAESSSAVRRDVCPHGQKRPRQEKSHNANRANKRSSKSSGASWATLTSNEGSRELIGVPLGVNNSG